MLLLLLDVLDDVPPGHHHLLGVSLGGLGDGRFGLDSGSRYLIKTGVSNDLTFTSQLASFPKQLPDAWSRRSVANRERRTSLEDPSILMTNKR